MNRYCFLLCLLLTAAMAGAQNNGHTTAAQQRRLPAPVQLFPADNARLPDSQEITFKWSSVPGAVRYGIQIDESAWGWGTGKGAPDWVTLVDEPSYAFQGRTRLASWRVWAIDNQGKPGEISEWLVFASGDPHLVIPPPPSSGGLPAGFSPLQPAPPLPAPAQIAPSQGARMSGYPREATFTWSQVPGASRYGIEIDYYDRGWSAEEHRPDYITSVRDTSFSFQFVGDQAGAWRVWSIDQASRPGKVSEWSLFSFGPLSQAMPSPPSSAPAFDQTPASAASGPSPAPANSTPGVAAPAPTPAFTAPDQHLPAPENITVTDTGAPVDSSGRAISRHTVKFKWSPVPGASRYGIEIDPYGVCAKKQWCSDVHGGTYIEWLVGNPYQYTYSFAPGWTGSFRVWGIDNRGQSGKVSAWTVFKLEPNDNKILPPPPLAIGPPRPLPFPIVMHTGNLVDPDTGENCMWPLSNPSGPGITFPRATYSPDPDYGETSRRFAVNGSAAAVLEIGADGQVKRACLLEAAQPDLGEQLLKAAKKYRLEPARKDGQPIPYTVTIQTSFSLAPRF